MGVEELQASSSMCELISILIKSDCHKVPTEFKLLPPSFPMLYCHPLLPYGGLLRSGPMSLTTGGMSMTVLARDWSLEARGVQTPL
jgi:hypothetical protein